MLEVIQKIILIQLKNIYCSIHKQLINLTNIISFIIIIILMFDYKFYFKVVLNVNGK
jgi:hypothetical protein